MEAKMEQDPVPESPARMNADPNRPAYVKAWLTDLGGEVADRAEELSAKMAEAGYTSKRGLRTLKDAKRFSTDFGVPIGLAADIVEEARFNNAYNTYTLLPLWKRRNRECRA